MVDNETTTGENSTPNQESSEQTTSQTVTKEELNQIVNAAISSRNKAFEKKFEELASKLIPKQETKNEDSELIRLRNELELMKKDKEEERAKSRELVKRERTREALANLGITTAENQQLAMALLIDANKSISIDENNEVTFDLGENGKVSLKSGLEQWSKTQIAKQLLPPTGTSGTGDKAMQTVKEKPRQGLEALLKL